ncbi:unnamed protein product [Bemisia tabaci]|uniref:Gag-like protein n=1 Tax=Bemisia tabaci TaxID=7038 RepID=A0A9P0AI76_BEMTA|nr:unnamed protein product [Bemisia tabaci]
MAPPTHAHRPYFSPQTHGSMWPPLRQPLVPAQPKNNLPRTKRAITPKPTPAPEREENANETILQIQDSDKALNADQVLDIVQQNVRLQQSGLYVLKTKRDYEHREVVVTLKNNYKANSIIAKALADTNLVVKEISSILTGVEIQEAPGHLSEEETIEALYDNNHELHLILKEKFTTSIVRMVKGKSKNEATNKWIIQASPEIQSKIAELGTLSFGTWCGGQAKKHFDSRRCFNCLAFNHAARQCTDTGPTCSRWARFGHMKDTCTDKIENDSATEDSSDIIGPTESSNDVIGPSESSDDSPEPKRPRLL